MWDHAVALSGTKLDELADLIGSAFGVEDLQVLLHARLDLQLYNLVPRGLPDPETIHQLLIRLDRLGQVNDILRTVKETRQERADLQIIAVLGVEAADFPTNPQRARANLVFARCRRLRRLPELREQVRGFYPDALVFQRYTVPA